MKYIHKKFGYLNYCYYICNAIKRNMNMKYLEQYIEEKIKIKVLGELTTRECCEGDGLGVSLVIDGYEPGIEIWYADYSNWLEEKLEEYENKNKKGQ